MSLVDTGGKDLLPGRGWESWRVHRAFQRWNLVGSRGLLVACSWRKLQYVTLFLFFCFWLQGNWMALCYRGFCCDIPPHTQGKEVVCSSIETSKLVSPNIYSQSYAIITQNEYATLVSDTMSSPEAQSSLGFSLTSSMFSPVAVCKILLWCPCLS